MHLSSFLSIAYLGAQCFSVGYGSRQGVSGWFALHVFFFFVVGERLYDCCVTQQ